MDLKEKPAVNPELDALDGEGRRVDAEAAGADPGAAAGDAGPGAAAGGADAGKGAPRQGEYLPSTAALVQGALLAAGRMMSLRYPAVRSVYTEQRCGIVGECLAPVLDRWGINAQNSVAMQYATAFGALLLLSMDTVAAIKSSTHEHAAPPGAPPAKPVP